MPLAVNTTTMLSWAYQTGVIDEIKPAASFLTNLLFPNERTVPTETLELSYLSGNRKLAPFVAVNGAAKVLPGRTVTFANAQAPNISVVRPMQAYQSLLRRAPGSNVFVDQAAILAAYRDAIFDDLKILNDAITNRKEWMAAQMATFAKIDYTAGAPDTEQDKFDITLPRLAAFGGNTGVALTGNFRWRHSGYATEGTSSEPIKDFDNVKFVMQKEGFIPRMAIMGREAARAFRFHSKVQPNIPQNQTNVGTVDYKQQFTEQGALLVTRDYAGVEVWEYSQTYEDETGTEQFFLDPNVVLFFGDRGISDNVTYYGAIADHELFQGGMFPNKTFVKSWIQPNPSVLMQMATTRPLPFCRRPNGIFTLVPVSNSA